MTKNETDHRKQNPIDRELHIKWTAPETLEFGNLKNIKVMNLSFYFKINDKLFRMSNSVLALLLTFPF